MPWQEHEGMAHLLQSSLLAWCEWMEWESRRDAVEEMRTRGNGDWHTWRVVRLASGDLIGAVELHSFDHEALTCEIGYWGDPRWTGQGLMTEAVCGVLRSARADFGMCRVRAVCDLRNLPAQRLAERVGMGLARVVQQRTLDVSGLLCDVAVYEIGL